MKNKKLKSKTILFLIIVCLFSAFFYSYKIINWQLENKKNDKIQEEIEEAIDIASFNNDEELKIDFNKLKEQNPDTVGYLVVNNTRINYAVVQSKDNDYYLIHNYKKEYSSAGWVFADYHNKIDESDKNIVIYAHARRDGSMFGTLKNVLKKNWYKNSDNHIITFTTVNGTYNYKVFSTYSIKAEDYYINTKFKNNDEFNKFVKTLKSRSIYNYKVDVNGNDKILTLSSCLSGDNRRVVLHAKLVD